MSVPVYRVVAPSGQTVAEYVQGATLSAAARRRALAHANRIRGRVFSIDSDRRLSLDTDFSRFARR